LLMNAKILMLWKKKIVKRKKYHHKKLGSAKMGHRSKAP